MNARVEEKLRLLAAIVAVGTIAGLAVSFAEGRISSFALVVGAAFGFITSVVIGGVELFVLGGPMRDWLRGVAIHRLLDRTFRLLTLAVVDYRGEVLNYIGDEVIVTWRERDGAIDCRPLRCFAAMRHELSGASSQFEREFGAVPRIRGSLHFGPVIVGEIGDVKRAIVFNGDVMNAAARLEELSRTVDGGSRAAMERFSSVLPFAIRDLGRSDSRTCRWHRRGRY